MNSNPERDNALTPLAPAENELESREDKTDLLDRKKQFSISQYLR